jgi:hypothetical protein
MSDFVSWAHSGRSPRFFMFDFRPAIFILIWIYSPSFKTFGLFLASMIIASILERFGITLSIAYQIIKVKIAGNVRFAVSLAEMSRTDR